MPSNTTYFSYLALASMILLPSSARAAEIIGHRGASHDAPENTVASVSLAWKQNADASEIDIYLTKDKRIIALHDRTTKKTTGKDWKPAERTLAELATLDAGSWKSPKYAGEPIPTLEDILDTIPPGRRLVIEIKCGPEVLPHLQTVLEACPKSPDQIVIIAFEWAVITGAKQRSPKIPCYWLYGTTPRVDKETGKISDRPDELLARCKAAGLDGLDIHHESQITPEFMKRMKDAGLGLLVWTVNDPEVARRMVDLGVAGITTDRPAWLREQLQTTAGQ
jgi:glycerophosphoryl diester phosphodiesterase